VRLLIPIICILLTGSQSAQPVDTHGMDLSASERTQLESNAAIGDASAAWRLYDYHSLVQLDGASADAWLRRAAELDHPQAQRCLARYIKANLLSPKGFGATASAAVEKLLERSARTEGNACNELASAYAEGYCGTPDYAKARYYYERGARFNYRTCWIRLARYCRRGIGGPRDDVAAYYWISLEARCVDPRSISGKETWALREEIASHLSRPTLERQWRRVDDFIAQVDAKKVAVDFAPFGGMFDPKLEDEGRRIAQQREDEHRRKWQRTND
jgi:hypothetical protein